MNEEEVRTSNPKHPTLVGYRMGELFAFVKMERAALAREQKALAHYKKLLRSFRERWGNNPPHTAEDWKQFWLELATIEDRVEDIQNTLSEIREGLETASRQGAEIVEANGVEPEQGHHLAQMEKLLERARSMQEERELA